VKIRPGRGDGRGPRGQLHTFEDTSGDGGVLDGGDEAKRGPAARAAETSIAKTRWRSSVLLVHPEPHQLDQIQTLLQPLALEIHRAHDFLERHRRPREAEKQPIDLVVGADIDIPEHDPRIVEGVRRVTSRIPVLVLIRDRSQKECPRATRLLTGLQQYIVWPQEAADLPAVARALLRTCRYLNGAHHDQLAVMRNERDVRRLRETLNALRATGGNVSQAAEILKMSRSGLNYRLKQLGLR